MVQCSPLNKDKYCHVGRMRTLQSKVDSKTKRKHLQLDSTVGVEHAEVRPSLFASSQTNDHSDTQLLLTYASDPGLEYC